MVKITGIFHHDMVKIYGKLTFLSIQGKASDDKYGMRFEIIMK